MLARPLNNQLSFIDRFFYSSQNWVWPILAEAARRGTDAATGCFDLSKAISHPSGVEWHRLSCRGTVCTARSYLWHARNADEHTLQRINQLQAAQAQGIEPTKEDIDQLERAMKNETRPWAPLGVVLWTPEHVLLLPVLDRGVRYDPPKEHLGKPIDNGSPGHIGGIALAYLDAMLKEAEALCC
jgi:hypothetical protein